MALGLKRFGKQTADPETPWHCAESPTEVAESLAVATLGREAGIELVVPLISQGNLIGTLNSGHYRAGHPYSTDDRSSRAWRPRWRPRSGWYSWSVSRRGGEGAGWLPELIGVL